MSALDAHTDGSWMSALVRDIADYPQPGVTFRDITPLLGSGEGFRRAIDELGGRFDGAIVDRVVGVEARGFIPGAAIAYRMGAAFVPVRKAGKLPGATHAVSYSLEYGDATLEMHQDAVQAGERVLLVDDVLATGGTVAATTKLVETCGATVTGVAVLLELAFLRGREALGQELPLWSLATVGAGTGA